MMPYIEKKRRKELSSPSNFTMGVAHDVGELNYKITCLVDDFISRKELKYSEINSVIGVLECAKMELYRRIAAPYEDKKCVENGDVYSIERHFDYGRWFWSKQRKK
jgi:hypothetical protein|tara:strand:- start:25 stop:342 length:318 start_codon:yes stop_codon:yes gene_type:complete